MAPQETSPRQHYQFGIYEIGETLGAGGMGIVYRAVDTALGRTVALKILRDDLRAQPHIVARFQREAEAIAKLDHPNIVHVHNVGRVGRIPFIAMEHIDGHTLGDVLRDGEKLPWREALNLGRQVAEALAAAHAAQIIHRDIKPGNILLDQSGKAYVTDFGIAKILNSASNLTVDGSRLGTPQYMCPERCRNRTITPASDLYSLGVVLFQALAGRLPHEANSNVELIRKITGEAPVRLRSIAPEVPEEVERFVAYLLELEPRNRPQHATEVVAAIDRILEGKALDQNLDHAMNAIAAYRDAIATPTPHGASEESMERDPLGQRIHAAWFRLSVRKRIVIALSGAALVCAPILAAGLTTLRPPTVALTGYAADFGMSAWTAPALLSRVRQEAAGVQRITPTLPGFELAALASDSAGGVALCLEASGGDMRAVLSLAPSRSDLTFVMPPRAFGADAGLKFMGGDAASWIAGTASGVYAVAREDDTVAHKMWDAPVSAWVPLGTTGDAVFAAPRTEGGSNLLMLHAALPGAPEHLAETVGEIVWAGVAGFGEFVYYAEAGETGISLWRRAITGHAAPSRKIASGIAGLGSGPMAPDETRFVAEHSDGSIMVLDAESGLVLQRLGTGSQPAWRPDAQAVIARAADYAGRPQLWSFPVDGASSVQLTHVEQGVGATFVVTPDRILAPTASGDSLLAVAL